MEIVSEFYSMTERYAEFKAFIDRAEKQKGTFPSQVIQQVVLEYQLKAQMEAEKIVPIADKLTSKLSNIKSELESFNVSDEDREKVQKYDLLKMIGAISPEEFQSNMELIKKNVDPSVTEALKRQQQEIEDALSHWHTLSGKEPEPIKEAPKQNKQVKPEPKKPEPKKPEPKKPEPKKPEPKKPEPKKPEPKKPEPKKPEPKKPEPKKPEPSLPEGDFLEEVSEDSFQEVMVEEASGDFGDLDNDDLGLDLVVSNDPPPAIEESSPVYDTIGVSDIGDDLDFDLSGDDDFALDDQPPIESADEYSIDELEFDSIEAMEGPIFDSGSSQSISEVRSAILLRDEGTPNEAMFSFTGESYTIGRSQDNDIQIKNDSKVSRHHCKLFRKTSHFYIEDQHSSNGTLVNGELISERRLYGGEEIKIGETVFRFRLQ